MTPWQSILADLLTTLVGVLAGGYLALRIDRTATNEIDKKRADQQAAEAQRHVNAQRAELVAVLQVLKRSLLSNSASLHHLSQRPAGDRTGPRLLDSAVWDSLRERATIGIDAPELVQRLAHHWLQLGYLNVLHRDITHDDLRQVYSEDRLAGLTDHRNSWARDLHADAIALLAELNQRYPELSSNPG